MHIKTIISGLLVLSCAQIWGMGADQRSTRVVFHAKRVAHMMRDEAKAPQPLAPNQALQAPQERQIQRANAGLITLLDAATLTQTVPAPVVAPSMPDAATPAGTLLSFMQGELQDRTAVAMGQLTVQDSTAEPMDIEGTPPTPVIDQQEQVQPASAVLQEHPAFQPLTLTQGLLTSFVAASEDAFPELAAALAATRAAHSTASGSSRGSH